MTSKIIVNTIEADTGISSVTFASNINLQNDSSVLVSSSGVTLGTGSTIAAPSANEITLSTNSAEKTSYIFQWFCRYQYNSRYKTIRDF